MNSGLGLGSSDDDVCGAGGGGAAAMPRWSEVVVLFTSSCSRNASLFCSAFMSSAVGACCWELVSGYSQRRPVRLHRPHEGAALSHFRLSFLQAVQDRSNGPSPQSEEPLACVLMARDAVLEDSVCLGSLRSAFLKPCHNASTEKEVVVTTG